MLCENRTCADWKTKDRTERPFDAASRREAEAVNISIPFGRRLDIGRHVAHFLERRIEQAAGQEASRIGQWLALGPLPRRDHGEAARLEDFAEQVLRHL